MIKRILAKIAENRLLSIRLGSRIFKNNKVSYKLASKKQKKLSKRKKDKTFTFWWYVAKNVQNQKQIDDVCSSIANFLRFEKSASFILNPINDIVVINNSVFVYTRRPGLLIGKCGTTIDGIQNEINNDVDGNKIHNYKIHIIEDRFSGSTRVNEWISFFNNNY